MAAKLNKKQKKQIDAARTKIAGLQKRLSGAKQQMDDPAEVERLKAEIKAVEEQIETIKAG